jgi:Cytosol aminopeptidase family, N-terminal domain
VTGPAAPPARQIGIGAYRGVTLNVAVWDAVGAEVELSCAGMFAREAGPALVGGLLHLDTAIGGALLRLRNDGAFRGDEMETLLLSLLPRPIRAKSLLVIGLGDPATWRPHIMERATRCAVSEAMRLGFSSAGIAPGLLDSGLGPAFIAGGGDAMLAGVVGAIDAAHRLMDAGLAASLSLTQWTFGAGASHAETVADQFRDSLMSLRSKASQRVK